MSYIGNEPIVSATRTVTETTATAGQTTFTANGGYTVGYIDVFVNGAQLQTSDFTATNGSTVVLLQAATVGDDVRLVAWGTFNAANVTLADGSVTAAKLASSSVTQAKVASGVAGTGPAFSAFSSSAQTVTTGTLTKLSANTEEFDTSSAYDNATNYRFTPLVSGYYQVDGAIIGTAASQTIILSYLYKNGSLFKVGSAIALSSGFSGGGLISNLGCIVFMNGTTDYLEYYGRVDGTGTCQFGANSYFQAVLVRAA
jgi:hypothetical protein